jgi:hypothetical protein
MQIEGVLKLNVQIGFGHLKIDNCEFLIINHLPYDVSLGRSFLTKHKIALDRRTQIRWEVFHEDENVLFGPVKGIPKWKLKFRGVGQTPEEKDLSEWRRKAETASNKRDEILRQFEVEFNEASEGDAQRRVEEKYRSKIESATNARDHANEECAEKEKIVERLNPHQGKSIQPDNNSLSSLKP